MEATMTNAAAERLRKRKRLGASILLTAISGMTVALFFFPFVTFVLSKVTYQFTSLQMVNSFMTVKGTAISMSLLTKAAVLLPLGLAVAGGVLVWLKKPVASAVCYVLIALCALAAMMSVNSMSSQFVDVGVGSISIGFHAPLALQLLGGLLGGVAAMWTKGGEKLAESVFLVFACVSVGSVLIITVYMIAAGTPAIAEIGLVDFLFGTEWNPSGGEYGIWNMILASFAGMFGAILIGVPIGLLTAVFLAELAPRRLASLVRPAIELLAGIPSVIYGFFGMMVLVPFIRRLFPGSVGESLLAMILILAVMVLPTIISVSETALRAVPASYKEASLALGNTHIGTIFKVLIPASKSGILAGVILGVGRAIGEAMAVVMVCGNMANFPKLLGTVRPLTTGVVLEMSYSSGLHRQALFSIGLVLFIFIMIVNISFTMLSKRGVKIDGKE
jgi:phosphate ABC transporter, permease protein pstC